MKQAMAQSVDGTLAETKETHAVKRYFFDVFEWSLIFNLCIGKRQLQTVNILGKRSATASLWTIH